MTSTPVTDVKAYFMNVTSSGAGNTADRTADFGKVMDSAARKSDDINRPDVSKTTKTEPAKTDQKPENVKDSSKKDLNASDRASDTKDSRKVEDKPGQEDTEAVGNFKEEVDEAVEDLKEAIMDKFGITEEELIAAMQTLGLSPQDLLNPDNIMTLMTELTGSTDTMALLTDETLYADVKELQQMAEDLSGSIQEQFNMTDEQFSEALAKAGKEQPMMEETKPVSEPMPLKVEVTADENTRTADGMTDTTGLNEQTTAGDAAKTNETAGEHQEKQPEHGTENKEGLFPTPQTVTTQTTNSVGDIIETVRSYANAEGENIMRQVTDYIKVNVNADTSSIEMQLHPASLGTVNIQITAANGNLTAQLAVQSEAVKAAMETQMVQLKETLNEQGIKVEAVEVTVAENNLSRDFDGSMNDERPEQDELTGRGNRRRANLNLNDLEGIPEDLNEEEQLTVDMMDVNGNSVDYTA
ncbi:MAG: flagellar hook-length control protein FliK [bacterium]|nr:flagellar hook-length control protein FliK [bacterium]